MFRLHKEALKQSATDPMSGKIDVSILTTGLSSAARKRRIEIAKALKSLIHSKGKVPTINYPKLYTELKEQSQYVSFNFIFFILVQQIYFTIVFFSDDHS